MKKEITITLDTSLSRKIDKLAKQSGKSVEEIVKDCVKQSFTTEEMKCQLNCLMNSVDELLKIEDLKIELFNHLFNLVDDEKKLLS